jgi:hypothetical protein
MAFSSKKILYYAVGATVLIIASYLVTNYKKSLEPNDEYDMIKKYLLNDSPLYGYNRPKLWIHTKYEINSRKWKDFYSRNTTDLNQPYIHLTIKTIIDHCGDDFNICLIDDETFSKLIPTWDIDLTTVAEPMKSHFRQLGLAQLVYFYGGMVVPNSFICTKNLMGFYEDALVLNQPFVCEAVNNTINNQKQKRKLMFIPDMYFMGAKKNDPMMKELVDYLKGLNRNPHFSNETDFVGDVSEWLLENVDQQRITLIGGEIVGVKTEDRKTILLDNLMEEEFLKLSSNNVGIYIPADEILRRPKFQWFAVMPSEELLKTNMIVSKYLLASIVDTTSDYSKKSEIRSVASL